MTGILAYCFVQKLFLCAESGYYYSAVRSALDTNFRGVDHNLQILRKVVLFSIFIDLHSGNKKRFCPVNLLEW